MALRSKPTSRSSHDCHASFVGQSRSNARMFEWAITSVGNSKPSRASRATHGSCRSAHHVTATVPRRSIKAASAYFGGAITSTHSRSRRCSLRFPATFTKEKQSCARRAVTLYSQRVRCGAEYLKGWGDGLDSFCWEGGKTDCKTGFQGGGATPETRGRIDGRPSAEMDDRAMGRRGGL